MPVLSNVDDVLIHVKAGSLDPIDIQIALGHGKVLRELFNNTVLVCIFSYLFITVDIFVFLILTKKKI